MDSQDFRSSYGREAATNILTRKIRKCSSIEIFFDLTYAVRDKLLKEDQTNYSIILYTTISIFIVALFFIGALVYKKMQVQLADELIFPKILTVHTFADHYRLMSANSNFGFNKQFEALENVGRGQPCTFAELPCNKTKNRFTNILPYDRTRFKLKHVDDEEGSDYINANYVPGHNSPDEFIATQGPLQSTRNDFWRMMWESNSPAIVMLTKCVEQFREKSDHYWPYDTLPVHYGDILVQILNENKYPDWNMSEFMVCRGDQQRVVQHFQYTTWPNTPHNLVRFIEAFREKKIRPYEEPIVVHCSDGVGRSGTFICLDRILLQTRRISSLDLFGIVSGMREERVGMIHPKEQYIYIFQCFVDVLEGKITD